MTPYKFKTVSLKHDTYDKVGHHSKPNTPLRIKASYPKKNEGWLAFGKKLLS